MSRLISRGMTGRIKIRISRAWRGYRVGDVIQPVAALRQQLLRQTDQLGNKIAELVEDAPLAPTPPAARVVKEGVVPKSEAKHEPKARKPKKGKE